MNTQVLQLALLLTTHPQRDFEPRPPVPAAIVQAQPASAGCNSNTTCLSSDVTIAGVPGGSSVRGVHVVLHLTGQIKFCTGNPLIDITQGLYLQPAGSTNTGLVLSSYPGGLVVIDQAITGDAGPCQTDAGGKLFTLSLGPAVAGGVGAVVIDTVVVRECDNQTDVPTQRGPDAAISFAAGNGTPITLTVTAAPAVIWPPDKKLHNIHVTETHSGGCGPVTVVLTSITASCEAEHHSKKPDIVGADFGTPDFDFQLRARECEEDEHGDDECEDRCEAPCESQCATQCDRHCDLITDRKQREQCREEQRECEEKCDKKCDKDCDQKCEQERDLVYTITYTASDGSSPAFPATTTVRIHGDKHGHASIAVSVVPPANPFAAAQDPGLSVLIPSIPRPAPTKGNGATDAVDHSSSAVTIPSLRFDGTDIDPAQIFLGNSTGLIAVPTIRFADVDGDGIDDVVANLSAEIVTSVRKLVATADDPITLYFRTKTGKGYEVSGLFAGGGPVAVVPPPIGDPARGNDTFLSQPGTGSTHTTRLGPTFPNPSRGSLTFTFELGRPGDARVEVYDLRGALIRTLMHGAIPAGRYDLAWDGRDDVGRLAANGLYLVHARAGDYRASRSLVLMR